MTIGGNNPRVGGFESYEKKNAPEAGDMGAFHSQMNSQEGASWASYCCPTMLMHIRAAERFSTELPQEMTDWGR